MTALVASAHIGGAIVVLMVLGVLRSLVGRWESEKIQQRRVQALSVQLGVSAEQLETEAHASRLLQLLAERSSPELLRNRLADFCGFVRTLCGWIGCLLEWGVLAVTIWFTVGESNSNSVFAWAAVAVAVFSWIVNALFSYACLLLTGRFPGEPGQARKALADVYKARSAMS